MSYFIYYTGCILKNYFWLKSCYWLCKHVCMVFEYLDTNNDWNKQSASWKGVSIFIAQSTKWLLFSKINNSDSPWHKKPIMQQRLAFHLSRPTSNIVTRFGQLLVPPGNQEVCCSLGRRADSPRRIYRQIPGSWHLNSLDRMRLGKLSIPLWSN